MDRYVIWYQLLVINVVGCLAEHVKYLKVLNGRKKVMKPCNIKLIISAMIYVISARNYKQY